MASHISRVTASIVVLLASLIFHPASYSSVIIASAATPQSDVDLIEFPLNLEYLEAEFFLFGALGHGLDVVAPYLSQGGPPPIGAKLANLDMLVRDVILQFGLQEVGHLRAIKSTVKGFPRPSLDLSAATFAKVMDQAFGRTLHPPFDPYANDINFLLASYVIPYVGLTGYVGTNPQLQNATSKKTGKKGRERVELTNKQTKNVKHIVKLDKKDNMALHSESVSSEKKSSTGLNELLTFNAENMQSNMKIIYYSRTFLSIIGGVVAGILGFTGLKGFVFYLLLMAITSVGLVAKSRFSIHTYFDSWNRVLLDGFLGGLMSFVLFWTYPSLS